MRCAGRHDSVDFDRQTAAGWGAREPVQVVGVVVDQAVDGPADIPPEIDDRASSGPGAVRTIIWSSDRQRRRCLSVGCAPAVRPHRVRIVGGALLSAFEDRSCLGDGDHPLWITAKVREPRRVAGLLGGDSPSAAGAACHTRLGAIAPRLSVGRDRVDTTCITATTSTSCGAISASSGTTRRADESASNRLS